jgi:hypothetical protein
MIFGRKIPKSSRFEPYPRLLAFGLGFAFTNLRSPNVINAPQKLLDRVIKTVLSQNKPAKNC